MQCKREAEMIEALRSGSWPAELLQHCDRCADCGPARMVAQALHRDADMLFAPLAQTNAGPPPAMRIWAAVQRRQRMAALDRATRFFRVLKIAGVVYASVFLLWSLHSLPGVARESLLPGLHTKVLNDSIAGAAFAVVCMGSGLWYALRRDRLSVE